MSGNLVFGQDRTTNSIHALGCDSNGHLDVNIATLDPATGLATEANQTNGDQKAKCMGGETDGTQQQLLVSNLGVLQTLDSEVFGKTSQIANQTTLSNTNEAVIIANQTNGNQVVKCMGNNGGSNVQLKVDANGVLETSGGGGGGGDATAANQSLQLAQETVTATNSSSIDNKITQGSDITLTNAQQMLCYGRDSGGVLDALRTDASGHLEVVVDDFVKGQTTMANSLPVNIASDQSRIDVQTVQDEVVISQVSQSVINPATFNSTAVDMRGYKTISFLGTSDNTSDGIKVLTSVDDIAYYDTGTNLIQDFSSGDFSYTDTLGMRYVKLQQGSGDFGGNFTITCISSKK